MPGGLSDARNLIKEGDNALKRKNFWKAEEKFQDALKLLVDKDMKVPLDSLDGGGVRSERYIEMDLSKRIVLQSCCRGMASALAGLGKDEEVRCEWIEFKPILTHGALQSLDWFEEVRVLNRNMELSQPPLFGKFIILLQDVASHPISQIGSSTRQRRQTITESAF